MWIIIAVFSTVQIYLLVWSISLFIAQQDCEYPANRLGWSVFLWIFTRAIQYLVWVYPLIYLFWPPGLTRALRKSCGCFKKRVPAHQRNMQSAGPKSGSLSDKPSYHDTSQDSSFSEGDEEITAENEYDDDDQKNFF